MNLSQKDTSVRTWTPFRSTCDPNKQQLLDSTSTSVGVRTGVKRFVSIRYVCNCCSIYARRSHGSTISPPTWMTCRCCSRSRFSLADACTHKHRPSNRCYAWRCGVLLRLQSEGISMMASYKRQLLRQLVLASDRNSLKLSGLSHSHSYASNRCHGQMADWALLSFGLPACCHSCSNPDVGANNDANDAP
jgi:hypothetical protein